MSDKLIIELQEDYNRERLLGFFKKHSKIIYLAAAAIVLSAGGYEAFKTYNNNKKMAAGDKLYAFISDFNSQTDAAKLAEIQPVYKEIGALVEANFHQSKNSADNAQKAYEKITADASSNIALKQLAQLNLASIKLNKNSADKSAEDDLIKLAGEGGIYQFTALEMLGAYYLKNGDYKKAKESYKKIAEDENAPRSMSGRAQSMLSSF